MPVNLTRRELLSALGLGGLTVIGSATGVGAPRATSAAAAGPSKPVAATDPAVERRDRKRARSGRTVKATVTAAPVTAIVGGKSVKTWGFGAQPGDGAIHAKVGDVLEATFVNKLPSMNTLHWHGIALRNDMDGVHDLTQGAVHPNHTYTYRFAVPDAGTHWFHPHMGLELDRGLYAPLIVEDPNDPLDVDLDVTLMLDDWLDGFGRTQEQVLAQLRRKGHAGHDMGAMAGMDMTPSGDTATTLAGQGAYNGDVSYPLHLINGRAGKERQTISAKPGQRIRFRVINAASDTAYKFAIGGHRMQVTHSDGFAVEPVNVDALRIGMGERYDVVVVAGSGAFTIAAVPEAKSDPIAEAVLRTTTTAVVPNVGLRPRELSGRVLAYRDLVPAESSRLPTRQPSRSATITLTQATSGYSQGIDGATYPNAAPLLVHEGERLRVKIVNATMMFHPMHLHGHSFQVVGSTRKDTVAVPSMGAVEIDIEADNPGQWMLHCHNTYHFETGMATLLSYRH